MAVKIACIKDLSHEEWLKLRKQGIGGSDAGSICGVNPYSSAFSVYVDKTSDESDTEDNERMRQGRDFEEYVARRFQESSGLKVHKTNYLYRHNDYPWMIADVDRVIAYENAGLECKTVSAWSADKWKSADKIPESYYLQCQHYMAVMGWDYMYLAGLILGSDFVYYRIDRNDELINNLIRIEKDFWENNVLAKVIPDPDGSKAYDDMLGGYFDAKKESSIPLIGFDNDLKRRSELTGLLSKMETEKKMIDQKLKLFLGENEVAENDRYRVSWKLSESTGQRRFSVREVA